MFRRIQEDFCKRDKVLQEREKEMTEWEDSLFYHTKEAQYHHHLDHLSIGTCALLQMSTTYIRLTLRFGWMMNLLRPIRGSRPSMDRATSPWTGQGGSLNGTGENKVCKLKKQLCL